MKSLRGFLIVGLLLGAASASADTAAEPGRGFSTVRIALDCGNRALAGWQLRADFGKSDARIVGVEGGVGPAFAAPPRYDARALRSGEIVLAALASGEPLPRGRAVVAVLHVEHSAAGMPPLEVSELIAVGADGEPIEAAVIQENGAER